MAMNSLYEKKRAITGTYGLFLKHKRLTLYEFYAMRTIIFQRENLNYLIVVLISIPCFFNAFVFYCQYM